MHMVLHRRQLNAQPLSDLLVGQTVSDEPDNLELTGGEIARATFHPAFSGEHRHSPQ